MFPKSVAILAQAISLQYRDARRIIPPSLSLSVGTEWTSRPSRTSGSTLSSSRSLRIFPSNNYEIVSPSLTEPYLQIPPLSLSPLEKYSIGWICGSKSTARYNRL